MTLSKERQKLNCLVATGDKAFQNGLQGNVSFLRTDFPALEINPSFVEAVQHPNAWNGVLHSLRLEECLPRHARNGFHPHRTVKELGKSGGNFIWWPQRISGRSQPEAVRLRPSRYPLWPPLAPACRAVAENSESHPAASLEL